MELAKIRNKALREASTVPTPQSPPLSQPLPDSSAAAPVVPMDERSEPTEAASVEQEPLFEPCLPVAAAKGRFNPLAQILAGREADLQAGLVSLDEEDADSAEEQELDHCREYLCFRLDGEEYGVSIMEIKEIIKPRDLTEVPRAPEFIDGILSLRGMIVPVIDMRRRLSLPPLSFAVAQRIVIVKQGESLTGLRVDEVSGVVRIYDSRREATPAALEGIDREFVAGIGRSDDRMVILLEVQAVVDVASGSWG